jgi:hydrogenase nickel incorporation protein HypB
MWSLSEMCGVCGCSETSEINNLVEIEKDILSVNNQHAMHNRKHFVSHHCFALNLVSSPGSGKTSLLEASLNRINHASAVIEGDQYTENDANRIKRCGVNVIQINTGKSCHLDAYRVGQAFNQLNFSNGILFIENVGNLVCPALFDVGEEQRVVMLSVTEGDDKPEKYQEMFASSDIVILNKIDLLPYVDFDKNKCISTIKQLSPKVKIFELSVTTGQGLDDWIAWLNTSYSKSIAA